MLLTLLLCLQLGVSGLSETELEIMQIVPCGMEMGSAAIKGVFDFVPVVSIVFLATMVLVIGDGALYI